MLKRIADAILLALILCACAGILALPFVVAHEAAPHIAKHRAVHV